MGDVEMKIQPKSKHSSCQNQAKGSVYALLKDALSIDKMDAAWKQVRGNYFNETSLSMKR